MKLFITSGPGLTDLQASLSHQCSEVLFSAAECIGALKCLFRHFYKDKESL